MTILRATERGVVVAAALVRDHVQRERAAMARQHPRAVISETVVDVDQHDSQSVLNALLVGVST